jgi:hypothetical protein
MLCYAVLCSAEVKDNLGALAVIPKLTPEIMAEMDELIGSKPSWPSEFRAERASYDPKWVARM